MLCRPVVRFLAASIAIATLPGSANAQAEAGLGRLFFTPQQRAALDLRRLSTNTPQEMDAPANINGLVRRSSGKQTTWVNGAPQETPPLGLNTPPGGSSEDLLEGGRIVIHSPRK